MANVVNTINYIEFPLRDAEQTKRFYHDLFGWEFTDWGPNYISFSGAGIDGGFNGEDRNEVAVPGVLVVLYTDDIGKAFAEVKAAGGVIIKPVYAFPGGRRFHFQDPNGNELAIWSED